MIALFLIGILFFVWFLGYAFALIIVSQLDIYPSKWRPLIYVFWPLLILCELIKTMWRVTRENKYD